MAISLDKKYKLSDGREVVLHTISGKGIRPVVGQYRVTQNSSTWIAYSWNLHGFSGGGTSTNLVEISPYEDWLPDDLVEIVCDEGTVPYYFVRCGTDGYPRFHHVKGRSTDTRVETIKSVYNIRLDQTVELGL